MKRKLPMILLCMVFLGIAGYSGIQLYREWSEYRAGDKAYEELTQYVHQETASAPGEETARQETVSDTSSDIPADETEPDTTDWPTVDFEALQAINPDVVAWIYIEGTTINYPVVQGTDNDDYLDRLFSGGYNKAGSIFMDYRSDRGLTDRNTVIYGHNLRNGSMFQEITNYKDQAFYDEHPVCLIMTPNGNYKLEFFAGYVTDLNSQAWKLQFASDEEYALWLEDAISKSTFTSSVEPTAQDRVVTLSTCTYEFSDARYVLIGILKEKDPR